MRRIAGSQTEVRVKREEMVNASGGELKKKDVLVNEIDLPTSKTALIPYINDLMAEVENGNA